MNLPEVEWHWSRFLGVVVLLPLTSVQAQHEGHSLGTIIFAVSCSVAAQTRALIATDW